MNLAIKQRIEGAGTCNRMHLFRMITIIIKTTLQYRMRESIKRWLWNESFNSRLLIHISLSASTFTSWGEGGAEYGCTQKKSFILLYSRSTLPLSPIPTVVSFWTSGDPDPWQFFENCCLTFTGPCACHTYFWTFHDLPFPRRAHPHFTAVLLGKFNSGNYSEYRLPPSWPLMCLVGLPIPLVSATELIEPPHYQHGIWTLLPGLCPLWSWIKQE